MTSLLKSQPPVARKIQDNNNGGPLLSGIGLVSVCQGAFGCYHEPLFPSVCKILFNTMRNPKMTVELQFAGLIAICLRPDC